MKSKAKATCKIQKYPVIVAAHDQMFSDTLLDFLKHHQWPERTQMHVIHVIEDNPLKKPAILPQDVIDDLTEEEQIAGHDVLNYLARQIYAACPGVRVQRHLVRGEAIHQILGLADRLPAKMICLGSHGRTGFERLVLGSVAAAVTAQARCSTVVLRMDKSAVRNAVKFEFTENDLPERMKEDLEIQVK
jgi:nucleotide-binding universal stress UspA family protein